jgi:hypothetical protein
MGLGPFPLEGEEAPDLINAGNQSEVWAAFFDLRNLGRTFELNRVVKREFLYGPRGVRPGTTVAGPTFGRTSNRAKWSLCSTWTAVNAR